MDNGKCCAMVWIYDEKGKATDDTKKCSSKSSKSVTTIGPDGKPIVRNVCKKHFNIAEWDRDNGGHWGLRVRQEGGGGRHFNGFVDEPSITLKYLVRTQEPLDVGTTLDGGKAKVMSFHHHCPKTECGFFLIHWKAPHEDPNPAKQEQLPVSNVGQVEINLPSLGLPELTTQSTSPEMFIQDLIQTEIIENQRKRR